MMQLAIDYKSNLVAKSLLGLLSLVLLVSVGSLRAHEDHLQAHSHAGHAHGDEEGEAHAAHDSGKGVIDTAVSAEDGDAIDWLYGSNVEFQLLDGYLRIAPTVHINVAGGDSTADHPEDLVAGGHDPNRSGVTLQGVEVGSSFYLGDYLQGFANYNFFLDLDDRWDGEWEEIFLKVVNLPYGIELRGGRFLNRFGFHNNTHLHSWYTVDNNLVNGRFLGDEGLQAIGGEIAVRLPESVGFRSMLSVGVGGGVSHDHDHGHGGEDEHGHEEEEAEFEAEGALFDSWLVTADYRAEYDVNDFNRFTGTISGGWGENEFGRTSQVYGVGLEYLWRENGYEPGGRQLLWRTELMYRNFGAVSGHMHEDEHGEHEDEHGHEEHHDDHDDHGDHDEHDDDHHDEHGHEEDHDEHEHEEEEGVRRTFDEFGVYSLLAYSLNDHVEPYIRAGWVSGISDAGLDSRFRVSPGVTFWADAQRHAHLRIQYNYDHSNDFGDEHSVWAQVGFSWGAPEVR